MISRRLFSTSFALTALTLGLMFSEQSVASTDQLVAQVKTRQSSTTQPPIPKNVVEIVEEASKPNNSPRGRPLPLASSWETGFWAYIRPYIGATTPVDRGGTLNTLDEQLRLLTEGHHWLPTVVWPIEVSKRNPQGGWDPGYYSGAWDTFARWHMPISFIASQWEQMLVARSEFRDLPPAQNPNQIRTSDNTIQPMLDPLGAVAPWYRAGLLSTTEVSGWRNIQERYPDPSLLVLVSNNEAPTLNVMNIEESRRWVDAYGTEQDADFKREKIVSGFRTRYLEMFRGMRDGLNSAPLWQKNSIFVGYDNNNLRHFARWGGWHAYSEYYPNHLVSKQTYWNGGSPSYYLAHYLQAVDYNVMSPQVEFMNIKFVNDLAYAENPDYWYEMSVWDGFFVPNPGQTTISRRAWYANQGDPFTPERYKAWIRYGMWLTKPRVVREFRDKHETQEMIGPGYRSALIAAVDEVYADPTLTRFWRFGNVVANTSRPHPYQQFVPPEYKNIPRWYNLSTNLDPAGNWALGTELPVFALALVIGEAPQREWLIYAYSPKMNRSGVVLTLPGYGNVTTDVPQAGMFKHVIEGGSPR